MLPDNILLDIFDFFRKNSRIRPVWEWHVLVHVCRSWRQIVFASPIRLNIQILCTYGTPVRKNLDIWPAFPIAVRLTSMRHSHNEDNALTALEHHDRVSIIMLCISCTQLERVVAVMREPFPALTRLNIDTRGEGALVFPADFLGGSTPCLQKIILSNFPFPALPTLLLSTSNLLTLILHRIPRAGYFSPEALGASFSALPNLKVLSIEFRPDAPRPRSGRLRPPPTARTVLPFLTSFDFHGAYGYLEALVAQIDSPRLNWMFIECWNRPVHFQVAQLSAYIHRSLSSEQRPFRRANVCFHGDTLSFTLYPQETLSNWDQHAVEITIACGAYGWQFSPLLRLLNQFSATLYTGTIIHLELNVNLREDFEEDSQIRGEDDVEWLGFLHQFPGMRVLHVESRVLARRIAFELEEITVEMVAEVLPFLELVYLEGQPASSVEKFITARRSTNYPTTVVDTMEEFNKRLESNARK